VAFRIAYQADVTGDSFAAVWDARKDEERLNDDQAELVRDLVRALDTRVSEIDERIGQAAEHWPLERMSRTDRAVLRLAIAELLARTGTPARVVLDEAVDIARRYGSDDSGRFVNGVLDRVARSVRSAELS
jgi:N utilization substance protein B